MSDSGQHVNTPPADTGPPQPGPAPRAARPWWRRAAAFVRTVAIIATVLLAVAIVTTITVDLGPAVRAAAERAGSSYLQRELAIGRLSIRLLTGDIVVESLRIGGLEPEHRPFLVADRIEVGLDFSALARREILIEDVRMTGWDMRVETWPNGRHSFPRFTRERREPAGPKRFVTTVRSVVATDGQFTFEDHGAPWSTVARNLEVVVRKTDGYNGTARFTGGTVAIQDFVPMWADMEGVFTIEGPVVRFSRLELLADGSRSDVTGWVDLSRWPEQVWNVRSVVQFPRMREIFFARENWELGGEGHFTGVFHLFKGGRRLEGDFTSAEARVNGLRFPDLEGSLVWLPERFEVTRASAGFYGGRIDLAYGLAPLGKPDERATARFQAEFHDVDMRTVSHAFEWEGLRVDGRLSGTSRLEWPSGRFAERRGDGRLAIAPPQGVAVAGRELPPAAREPVVRPWGPFNNDPRVLGDLPIGGEVAWRLDPEWITLEPSWMASPKTYVAFEGRTAYGRNSAIPFHVTSADWQESDRVLAGIMTALGSPTNAVPVGGVGTFDGTMRQAFRDPRVEGRFRGDRMWAWDVEWGRASGDLVIEDGYVALTNARVTAGDSVIETEGRYSLGYPRRDGGEEINARVRVSGRPLVDLRHAFGLDDYPVDGRLSGEFHLYGHYEGPFGFGRMRIDDGVAYGEPFEWASTSLRFEGGGVRLDGIEAHKAGGGMTGAAFVSWDGTYSFNFTGRRVPVESIQALAYPQAPLTGLVDFSASGSGAFESPQYTVRLSVFDLYVKDEGIGEVTARLTVRDGTLGIELDAASPRLIVSGAGRVAMNEASDADITLRFTETSLDPYVRTIFPELSPFTTAVASGTLRIAGELANPQHLRVQARADALTLNLFDYIVRNDGPLDVAYEQETVRINAMRLVGEGTRLDVAGSIDTGNNRIAVRATGDANLGILQGFMRDLRSTGQADLVAEINGPLESPVFSGSASVAGGRFRHFSLPHALEAVNGRVAFDGQGVRLDGVTARLGGGLVRFGGRIGLRGYRPGEFNLTATGENMRLRYPEGFRSVVDADLSLRGPFESPVLGGTVTVRSSVWSRRIDASVNFLEFAGRATPEGGPAAPSRFPLRFDVRLVAPSSLRIDNNLARIVSSADLALRGTYDRPLLFGRAEIERGDVTFEGRRYVVRHGTIDFSNPNRIEPFFDLEAETRVRVPGQIYTVTLNAAGTFSRLQWGLTSDPPLPTVDVLALLLNDTTPTDPELAALRRPDEAEQQLLQARAAQLLVSPISSGVTRVVEQTFGINTFQITPSLTDPAAQSSRLIPGARLTIGKRISNRVYVTFSQSLSASTTTRDQVILLEYDQNDRLSWVLSQNEDRTYALDVRVRHAF
ncbi:MAG TPA: translocation/assembly module TamB domain-containing protein [Vicinamibacterales bacterium]